MKATQAAAVVAAGVWSGVLAGMAHAQVDDDDDWTSPYDEPSNRETSSGSSGGPVMDDTKLTITVVVGGIALVALLGFAVYIATSPTRGSASLQPPLLGSAAFGNSRRRHNARSPGT